MGSKKRTEPEPDNEASDASKVVQGEPQTKKNLKPMERRKKRKTLDKVRHQNESDTIKKKVDISKPVEAPLVVKEAAVPATGFHVDVFRDLAAADVEVRKKAAERLASELVEVQRVFETEGGDVEEEKVKLEAEKDDGLEGCAPSLGYAIRRLIRGVSSSRECARQGFALGLSVLVAKIPAVRVETLMKLIVNMLEVSASMKGQEAKDCLLGRLFAYGSLARSERLTSDCTEGIDQSPIKDFVSDLMSLAGKKRYLREPAIAIVLDIVRKLPLEAVTKNVIEVPGVKESFQKAVNNGDPDALFLALKIRERVPVEMEIFGELLPCPFSADSFFTRDHLTKLIPCFKESTFCHPRVHSLWPLLVNILVPALAIQDEAVSGAHSAKKHKKSRKGGSIEDMKKNIRCFCEVVVEESLLSSSHERKHLALMILLLLLPHLPASCITFVLSYKLVQCLLDTLSIKGSYLHETALYFMKELLNWVGNNDDRCVAVIVALQKHSAGRFDGISKTHTVKGLVAKLVTGQGCLLFVQNITRLFVEDEIPADEPSDQSQTTDENSEIFSIEDKESPEGSTNVDTLKSWIVDTMPRVLKNLKLDSNAKSLADTEIVKFLEEKFQVQAEIMKFLAVQGLFSASLGTEITSFELQEKFSWPKAAISSSLCRMCIGQLQLLLEDAQRGEVSNVLSSSLDKNDLGSYLMCFFKTLCNIPSVSLYRKLSDKDQVALKTLQEIESRLLQEERNITSGVEANKLHALRYVLIQLVLQVLLSPEEFYESASELAICCKKAFPGIAAIYDDSFEEESEFNDNEVPDLMDVLLETFLSLLPHSSGSMCFAIEQAFKFFCDDVTVDGILQMLRVVKKDLKPLRHQTNNSRKTNDQTKSSDDKTTSEDQIKSSDDKTTSKDLTNSSNVNNNNEDSDLDLDSDSDDDFLGIEDLDESSKGKTIEADDGDGHEDEMLEGEKASEKRTTNEEVNSGGLLGADASSDDEGSQKSNDHSSSGDSDEDEMDDDEMLMKDAAVAEIIKQRLSAGKDSAQSQLWTFKSRVLSLIEIFLQKHPGKSQVILIYSHLVRAFIKYHTAQNKQLKQLGQRIGGILQKKIFKAKDYPKGNEISIESLEPLLKKGLRSASRSSVREVASLAQASMFWLLKITQSRSFDQPELGRVVKLFQHTLDDYFYNKNSRLKVGFVKEVIRRHLWIGHELFGFLLEKCGVAKSEFRRIETLAVLDCVIKSWTATTKGEDASSKSSSKLLKENLPAICNLIQVLLSQMPEKQSRRAEVRRFCTRTLNAISSLNLKRPFLKALKPEAYSLCESHLGNAFIPFKTPSQ